MTASCLDSGGHLGLSVFEFVTGLISGSVALMADALHNLKLDELATEVEFIEGVVEIHHLHVWELDEHSRAMEAHVVIAGRRTMDDLEQLKKRIKALLQKRFMMRHSTLEFESEDADCEDGRQLTPSHQ